MKDIDIKYCLALPFCHQCTLQSMIIGKGLSETASAGRAKLPREIRVPISNNYAPLSILRGA